MLRHITAGLLALRGLVLGTLPFCVLQPLTDGRLLRRCPLCVLLGFFQFLTASAVVDNAVDHAVVILQRHFSGSERIVLFRLLRCYSKGPCTIPHDKILLVIGNMVDAVTGCLHLLPAHGSHIKAAPGRPDALAGFQIIRGKLRLPFPQKLWHFGKAHPIAVMSGVLSVLIQHYDIRYGQGVPGEVCRAVHVEPGIDAFQIVLRRQRGGINLLIVLRLHGKTVVTDGIQRLKAVVPRTISRFQLIDGEGVALRRPRLLHDSSGGLAASAA